jgi:hypothetical protein
MNSGNTVLDELREKINEAELQLSDAQRRAETLRIACAEVEAVISSVTGPTPSTSKAVRVVISESRQVWTVSGLTEALARRGWSPHGVTPDATIRTALYRLKKAGVIEVVNRGRYRIAENR